MFFRVIVVSLATGGGIACDTPRVSIFQTSLALKNMYLNKMETLNNKVGIISDIITVYVYLDKNKNYINIFFLM